MWLWQSFDLCIDMSRRCRHSARFFFLCSCRVIATYKFIKTKQFAYPWINQHHDAARKICRIEKAPCMYINWSANGNGHTGRITHWNRNRFWFSLIFNHCEVDGVRSRLDLFCRPLMPRSHVQHARTQWPQHTIIIIINLIDTCVVDCTPSEITCKHNIV